MLGWVKQFDVVSFDAAAEINFMFQSQIFSHIPFYSQIQPARTVVAGAVAVTFRQLYLFVGRHLVS